MSKLLTPFDGLLDQFLVLCHLSASKQIQKLCTMPKDALPKLLHQFNTSRHYLTQKIEAGYDNVVKMCMSAIRGPHIKIIVDAKLIHHAKFYPKPYPIFGKLKFSPPGGVEREIDCYISFGNWEKLGKLGLYPIDLMEHLDKLLPKYQGLNPQGGPIGLVTYQNGIMNDFAKDFRKMSELIVGQFPEGPLCIGLHNATTNILPFDMQRFVEEAKYNENSVYSLCQMIKTFAERIPKINPNMVWTHIAHSEGGLIANAVLELCNQVWLHDVQKYIKRRLVVATYGAVKPVHDEPVLAVVNTYSNRDIALFFGSNYLDKSIDQITGESYTSTKKHLGKTYTVTVVDSKLPFDPAIKIQFEPEMLTLEQRLNLSWMEWIAHIQASEGSSRIANTVNTKITDIANQKIHEIKDHGFAEVTYQEAFKINIERFRVRYKVYDPK